MNQHIDNFDPRFKIIFPDGYTEDESKVKEWVQVRVELPDGKLYEISFQAPTVLKQSIERTFENQQPYFFEPNLIVVAEVTIENIKKAVAHLFENDQLKNFSDYKSKW